MKRINRKLTLYKIYFIITICLFSSNLSAQTNKLESTGNVGIGTTAPKSILQVTTNAKDYFVNRSIGGETEDSKGINYLLLHKLYTSGPFIEDHFVFGKITAKRGGPAGWNRKFNVDVHTSSAYDSNRGSIISYNEASRLVTLTYAGERYLAVEIAHGSSLYNFSFTGYARYEKLEIKYDQDVSDVQVFTSLDPVRIQGALSTSSLGVGTTDTKGYTLAVAGSIVAESIKVALRNEWPDYVFSEGHKLLPLNSVESFIQENNHLPDIPSAVEVKDNGIDLGEMNAKLLKKVEELTLYLIQQSKDIERLQFENRDLTKKVDKLDQLMQK